MKRHEKLIGLSLLLVVVVLGVILVARGQKSVVVKPPTPAAQAAQASSASPAVKAQASLPCPPPPGEGVVGACTPKPVQVFGSRGAVPKVVPATVDPPVCIPDVSSWQGSVDWGAVKAWQLGRGCHPAGIFKMGEYVADPWAYRNNSELARLGMWRAGYWYLRRTGAAHEALQIVQAAHIYGLKVVIEDDETPEAAGYDGPVTAGIHALDPSLTVAEYASPGAYPGGSRSSNPAWIAAYGPASPPPAPWGGPIKAFQCSDGIFGCVTYVPGIGRGDVSVDYGLTSLGVGPVGPSSAQVRKWIAARGSSLTAYLHGCKRPTLTSGACGQFAWRVDHFQKLIDTAHGYYPRCFGKTGNVGAAECRIVRPAVAVWSRARSSTGRAEGRLGCHTSASSSSACKSLGAEYVYFDRRVQHALATSRL